MPAKRPLLSGDPFSPSKRPRTRSSFPNLPPTPDDLLSVAESATPSRLPSVKRKVPAGPANPGIIRNRDNGALSRLPLDSDALDTFANLRRDFNLSNEEAFLKLITTYDVPLSTLNRISTVKLLASFSKAKYSDVAPYVWLDPSVKGSDIRLLDTFRSRIPVDIFRRIHADVNKAILQYGRMASHNNEEARSRFIASFFSEIVCLFGSAVVNKPEGLLDAKFTKKGRIEHHFYAFHSVSIVFLGIKKNFILGDGRLDVIAQVLAECAACDYANSKSQHWVPILAILCDGEKFEFLVYDSGTKSVYSSDVITGVVDMKTKPSLFLSSAKETTEYLFDYFLMAYINGLRSFGHRSELVAEQSKSKKRKFTEKWMDALARAEYAHSLCREAAELAQRGMFEEAEETAARGIVELKESVSQAPDVKMQRLSEWDEEVVMKA
jgi:hypothetical protein